MTKASSTQSMVSCPDPQYRDLSRAVELAHKAIELAPEQADFWTTLGAAQYSAGEFPQALTTLTHSLELNAKRPGAPRPVDMVSPKPQMRHDARNLNAQRPGRQTRRGHHNSFRHRLQDGPSGPSNGGSSLVSFLMIPKKLRFSRARSSTGCRLEDRGQGVVPWQQVGELRRRVGR